LRGGFQKLADGLRQGDDVARQRLFDRDRTPHRNGGDDVEAEFSPGEAILSMRWFSRWRASVAGFLVFVQ
jgi:hypothetical protein